MYTFFIIRNIVNNMFNVFSETFFPKDLTKNEITSPATKKNTLEWSFNFILFSAKSYRIDKHIQLFCMNYLKNLQ